MKNGQIKVEKLQCITARVLLEWYVVSYCEDGEIITKRTNSQEYYSEDAINACLLNGIDPDGDVPQSVDTQVIDTFVADDAKSFIIAGWRDDVCVAAKNAYAITDSQLSELID